MDDDDDEPKSMVSPYDYEPSAATTDENQINPVTMMTSHPAFVPVADNADVLFDLSDLQIVPRKKFVRTK